MRRVTPQFNAEHARRWQDADAAECYVHRIPYPEETFDVLRSLITDEATAALDVGCGTGNIARALAPFVDRVDAIDIAAPMIEVGRRLPRGASPNILWQVAPAESAGLRPPYALVVGGASLHWMDYEVVLPRFRKALTERGVLAVVRLSEAVESAWDKEIKEITERYSTAKEYVPFDMITIWEEAQLYRRVGTWITKPAPFEQSIENFIAAFHAQSNLTRAHVDSERLDAEVHEVMKRHCPHGFVRRQVVAHLEWGKPL